MRIAKYVFLFSLLLLSCNDSKIERFRNGQGWRDCDDNGEVLSNRYYGEFFFDQAEEFGGVFRYEKLFPSERFGKAVYDDEDMVYYAFTIKGTWHVIDNNRMTISLDLSTLSNNVPDTIQQVGIQTRDSIMEDMHKTFDNINTLHLCRPVEYMFNDENNMLTIKDVLEKDNAGSSHIFLMSHDVSYF